MCLNSALGTSNSVNLLSPYWEDRIPLFSNNAITSEQSELSYPRVTKTDNSSELFSEDKVKKGVYIALEKRENTIVDIDNTFNNIFKRCRTHIDKEISSNQIGKIVMDELLKLDHVAYLRFASVYLNFEDKEAFTRVIKDLEKDLSPEMKKLQKNLLQDE